MQWTAMTCERLNAIQIHADAEDLAANEAGEHLKAAEKARDESEVGMIDAIKAARAEHKAKWPELMVKTVIKHSEDLERRSRVVNQWKTTKGRHLKEAARARLLLSNVIREARDGESLFEKDDPSKPLHRDVQLSDICEEDSARMMAGESILTVGDVIDACAGPRMKDLVREKKISVPCLNRVGKAVHAYCTARGIDVGVEGAGESGTPTPDELPAPKAQATPAPVDTPKEEVEKPKEHRRRSRPRRS